MPKILRKPFRAVFISVLLVTALAASAQETSAKATGLSKVLQGRSYVRLQKDATCKANDAERTVLKTWGNRVSFSDGNMLVWGTVCNDSAEQLPLSAAGSSLLISADLKRIVYKNEVLRYVKEVPRLCEGGQWCPAEQAKP
jgi:hypothetical protein